VITYFVELASPALAGLLQRRGVLEHLASSGAGVAMAMLDLDRERADVIRELHARGIPVTAWLVLEESQGYWLTADNAELAQRRYERVRDWGREHGLELEAVGLDIEIPHEHAVALVQQGGRALRQLLRGRRSQAALGEASRQYAALVELIRADGFRAETYQFPLILDERRAGTSALQRTLGVVDLAPDREVLMLYRSLLPGLAGEALVDAYGAEAQAIAVGITGGGVEFLLEALDLRLLDLGRLLTELRRARRYTEHLYVFSLEGCVEAGFFEELCEADLSLPAPPARLAALASVARAGLRGLLRAEGLLDLLRVGR
jgi:hypothetical protein